MKEYKSDSYLALKITQCWQVLDDISTLDSITVLHNLLRRKLRLCLMMPKKEILEIVSDINKDLKKEVNKWCKD